LDDAGLVVVSSKIGRVNEVSTFLRSRRVREFEFESNERLVSSITKTSPTKLPSNYPEVIRNYHNLDSFTNLCAATTSILGYDELMNPPVLGQSSLLGLGHLFTTWVT
jgi:hypothetical protein